MGDVFPVGNCLKPETCYDICVLSVFTVQPFCASQCTTSTPFLRIAQSAEMSNIIFQQKYTACSKDILDTAFLLKDMFSDDLKRDTKYDICVKTKC